MKLSKLLCVIAAITLCPFAAIAQDSIPTLAPRFAYLAYDSIVLRLPQYTEADIELSKLRDDYDSELEESRQAFEHKYIEFMLEQESLAAPIIAKRQKELQLMLETDTQLREELQRDLEARRSDALESFRNLVANAASLICIEMGLDFVIDSGSEAFLFVNPQRGVDISDKVFDRIADSK